jgi:hypothetical protein
MDKITAQCTDDNQWYYNLTFVNNFYFDSGFAAYIESLGDDTTIEDAYSSSFSIRQRNTCLPWTWFYAVYMQLSVFLPFGLYFVCHYMKHAQFFYVAILVMVLIQKFVTIDAIFQDLAAHEISTIGITNPSRNTVYYAN